MVPRTNYSLQPLHQRTIALIQQKHICLEFKEKTIVLMDLNMCSSPVLLMMSSSYKHTHAHTLRHHTRHLHTCAYTHKNICIYIYIKGHKVCMDVRASLCGCVCLRVCVCAFVCMYARARACVCVYLCVHICIHFYEEMYL